MVETIIFIVWLLIVISLAVYEYRMYPEASTYITIMTILILIQTFLAVADDIDKFEFDGLFHILSPSAQ